MGRAPKVAGSPEKFAQSALAEEGNGVFGDEPEDEEDGEHGGDRHQAEAAGDQAALEGAEELRAAAQQEAVHRGVSFSIR